MELRQLGHDRLELTAGQAGPAALPRHWMLILLGALAAIMIGTGSWSFAPILIIGAIFTFALRKRRGGSVAVLDRTRGTVTLSSIKGRQLQPEQAMPLESIDKVIVEARSPEVTTFEGRRRTPVFAQWQLLLRPALLVGTRVVPLAEAFEKGERPINVARRIRAFLGHPDTDLLKDSIEAQVRNEHTAKAGRHLARHVLDLDYFEADDLVKQLRGESEAAAASGSPQPVPANDVRGRRRRFRIGYRQEGWAGLLLYVLMFAAFVWGGSLLSRLLSG